MKIKDVRIQNFRSIEELTIPLDEVTVLIGANNSGKSAIVEALRIALSRRWGQQGTGFTENDIRVVGTTTDPRECGPIKITVTFEETPGADWPEDMLSVLEDIVTQTSSGRNQICISISYEWKEEEDSFIPSWEFLNSEGDALSKKRRAINLSGFFDYLLFYWLGALRDADSEFKSRGRHWGGLLKSMDLSKELEQEILQALDALDAKILAADQRFSEVAKIISQATEVSSGPTPGEARFRMLPMSLWDLLERAGLVLKKEQALPWLPLDHHGQGLQSLAVLFLIKAAVSHALSNELPEGASPIFAIEEPEAHLHPQAARTLWAHLTQLPGQKLLTTHSPYFVQHVPLHNIRLIRFSDGITALSMLKRDVVSELPWTQEVDGLVNGKKVPFLFRDEKTGCVSSTSWFGDKLEKDLADCWKGTPEHAVRASEVAKFRHECRVLISPDEEKHLSLLGRRFRGEIFFSRSWVLVEGQCEYALLHALGVAESYELDQHGISVIDFQNNGNPAIYAALATAFGIPWQMIVDGDNAGNDFKKQLLKRGFSDADIASHVKSLADSHDLEDQLISDGHEMLLREILSFHSDESAKTCDKDIFVKRLKNKKTEYISDLALMVVADQNLAKRMPSVFVSCVEAFKTEK